MAEALRFEYWAGRLRGRPRQILVLTRHFFQRLFQNDVFPFAEQMKEKVYVLLAMIAALGWFVTNRLFIPYIFVQDQGQSWREKLVFLTFFMLFLALAVVLEWDVLFPDLRDHLNLTPLPVKPETIITSKFAAFALFVAMYTAAVCFLSVFGVAIFLPRWTGDSLRSLAAYCVAHVAAAAAAFAFVFLFFLFLEAVLLAVLGARVFRAISLGLRFVMALTVIMVMALVLTDARALQAFLDLVDRTREVHPLALLWWPPVWYVSIYETLIGRSDPFYAAGANIGLAALLILAVADRMAMSFGYRRHLAKAGEVRTRARIWPEVRRVLSGGIDRMLFLNPVEKAVFHFVGGTIRRSALHKVRLAGSLVVSLAGLFLIIGLPRTDLTSPRTAGINVLGAPLVLGFFLLMSLRSVFNVPFAAEANWIFRATEREDRRPYYLAVKKLIAACFLLPFGIFTGLVYGRLWGAGPAILHALYSLAWAALFTEVLFWKYARIPFACHVVPGKARLYSRWLPYSVAFFLIFGLLTALETALFKSVGKFVVCLAMLTSVAAGLEIYQRQFVYPRLPLVFEEEPEPIMISL